MRAPLVVVYVRAVGRLNRRARAAERERDEALDLAASLYADLDDAERREAMVRADCDLIARMLSPEMRRVAAALVRDRRRICRLDEVEV